MILIFAMLCETNNAPLLQNFSSKSHFHPSLGVLKRLCCQLELISSLSCDSCHFNKYHRIHSVYLHYLNKRVVSMFLMLSILMFGVHIP